MSCRKQRQTSWTNVPNISGAGFVLLKMARHVQHEWPGTTPTPGSSCKLFLVQYCQIHSQLSFWFYARVL